MGERQPLRAVEAGRIGDPAAAVRQRGAVELIRSHERTLRRTARRYSLCADDAEDALQRALEILLTKAPTSDPRQLIRWMQTVTKHEALAVRRTRERNLGLPVPVTRDEDSDWVQSIPSEKDGPADSAERRERIGRAREALKTLKPQELRALTLLAEGYSYAEICEQTGWTYTKVNRCLAEGRQRFRAVFGSIEEGRRCEELAPTLSAFADGEASSRLLEHLLAHLKECSHCRSKLRDFRVAPRAAAALAPTLPVGSSFAGRLHELVGSVQTRLPGRTGAVETTMGQFAAAGGSRGTGMALAAKLLTACVGTAGGAAACVAAGVVPPVHVPHHAAVPEIERVADEPADPTSGPVATAGTGDTSALPDAAPTTAAPLPNPAPAQPPPPPASQPPEFSPEAAPEPTAQRSAGSGEFGGASPAGGSAGGGAQVHASSAEFGP